MWLPPTKEEVMRMVEIESLFVIIELLFAGLVSVTIIAVTLIVILIIISSK